MTRKWLPIGGLVLLSLLWAVGWVRADLFPGASASGAKLTAIQSQALLLGAFAALAALAAAILKKRWPSGMLAGKTALVGLGLFVVPALLTVWLQQWMDDTTRVALFSLVPLFAVIFEPHFQQGRDTRGGFPAAMVAVTGTLLVFPFQLPHSYAAAGALVGVLVAAASVAGVNCMGVEVVQRHNMCPLTAAAVSAGSASIVLEIAALAHIGGSASAAIGVWAIPDLVGLALLFWLMRHMSAAQMTTRFLIAPLLANLISLVLLRPHVEVQSWIGLLLIAAGAGWLVFAPPIASRSTVDSLELN